MKIEKLEDITINDGRKEALHSFEVDLLAAIPVGQDNAIKRDDLAKAVSSTPRSIRYAIQALRLKGCPIIARRGGGYFLPDPESGEDMAEMRRFISMMRAQASERFATVHALGSWLQQVESKQATWIK